MLQYNNEFVGCVECVIVNLMFNLNMDSQKNQVHAASLNYLLDVNHTIEPRKLTSLYNMLSI